MIDSIAGSIGIKFLGKSRVASDSYFFGIEVMVGLCVASAVSMLILMHIRRKSELQTAPV